MNALLRYLCLAVVLKILSGQVPTRSPTYKPTISPSQKPVFAPTSVPSSRPTSEPTSGPTVTMKPTPLPSSQPSSSPTLQDTMEPSGQPSSRPSQQPTGQPSFAPTSPTGQPTSAPNIPSSQPSSQPSVHPTYSHKPTRAPSCKPTTRPSANPTARPSASPTTHAPTRPTTAPTEIPTRQPTAIPTRRPTRNPTPQPTTPTSQPSSQPSGQPIGQPTTWPTGQPSSRPSRAPRRRPTPMPTSNRPSVDPSSQPSSRPSSQPSSRPTAEPTVTKRPTSHPSARPSRRPSGQPSSQPSGRPTTQPSMSPTSPTSQPTSTPSTQPSSQPSSRPSVQPSNQPSRQPTSAPTRRATVPTFAPTVKPSVQPSSRPSALPTNTMKPSPQPTSQPSSVPSAQPILDPTSLPTIAFQPTSSPSKLPTPYPTHRPSFFGGIPFTEQPTAFYETIDVSGTVEFEPDAAAACNPVEVRMSFSFTKNITAGSTFTISTPGLTTGACYNASNGYDISTLYIPNNDYFTVSYREGSYLDNFASSRLSFLLSEGPVFPNRVFTVVLDRTNKIRRSCSMNTTWEVTVIPNNGRIAGAVGSISLIETYPKRCFVYYANLYFMNAAPQFYAGVNATLRLGYEITAGTTVTLHLPGFTNSVGAYGLNVLVENSTSYDAVRAGYDTTLFNITSSTNFTWSARWEEGSYTDNFQDSKIVLTAYGYQNFNDLFWVVIPKTRNHLIPVCGHPRNDKNIQISTKSQFFYSNATSVTETNVIGPGCGKKNSCSGNGRCDYCTSTCTCNQGFGSIEDQARAVANDFLPDCSSRACPVGPSLGSIVRYDTEHNGTYNKISQHMHGLMECSANGLCDRKTGRCKCTTGFSGAACQKMDCGGTPTCSGRGRCLPMKRLASSLEALPLSSVRVDYVNVNQSQQASWDGNMGHTCVCDSSWPVGLLSGQTQLAEYFGPTCEKRRCPSGDDPNTRQKDETDCEGIAQTGRHVANKELGQYGNKCHIDCSNRGTCNYKTGVCSCYSGFKGENCGSYA